MESSRKTPKTPGDDSAEAKLSDNLHESERLILMKAITTCRNTREMAASLGISQAGVSRKLKKHGLPLPKHRALLLMPREDQERGGGKGCQGPFGNVRPAPAKSNGRERALRGGASSSVRLSADGAATAQKD
ncbi:MAG: hypothetical protein LBQ79_01835 [Deltaproteobacteria bacterium]|nr:hypothetical protein [Deltaproteobacteria bacterium]